MVPEQNGLQTSMWLCQNWKGSSETQKEWVAAAVASTTKHHSPTASKSAAANSSSMLEVFGWVWKGLHGYWASQMNPLGVSSEIIKAWKSMIKYANSHKNRYVYKSCMVYTHIHPYKRSDMCMCLSVVFSSLFCTWLFIHVTYVRVLYDAHVWYIQKTIIIW